MATPAAERPSLPQRFDVWRVLDRYPAPARANVCLRELCKGLGAVDPGAPLASRLEQIETLATWLGRRGPLPLLDGEPLNLAPSRRRNHTGRLQLLLRVLADVPEWRETTVALIRSVLAETSALRLFLEAGLPNDRGLREETGDRLARRFLPEPPDDRDLARLVSRMFRSKHDAAWLAEVDPELIDRAATALAGDDGWRPLRESADDAVSLLATRASALGLSRDIRERSPAGSPRGSPYFHLPRDCDAFLDDPEDPGTLEACRARIVECRAVLQVVHDNMETRGVSVDVVYMIDVISSQLTRLDGLLTSLSSSPDRTRAARSLVAALATARLRDRSLRDLLGANVRLLARKVIERAGQTGEHYITSSRSEWWKMIASASGGGFLTAGTVLLKFQIAWQHLPLLVEGLAQAGNYAGSFILMQLLGFTLATKQPSMTAAALAGSLGASESKQDIEGLVTTIARIVRSQLAAAIGNIGMVIPTALGLHFLWTQLGGGAPFLGAKDARYVLQSLDARSGMTWWFAGLTGVFLWASSMGAGWLENWAVYRRLPDAIAEHRWGRIFGRRTMHAISRAFARNVAGFGGNVTLGTLLGMAPVLKKFTGLPIGVLHVTLSTGSLVLAACTLGPDVLATSQFRYACLGIVVIGALNFGVSFWLALAVALRARGVGGEARWRLRWGVLRRLIRSPWEFFFPPRNAPPIQPEH